MNTQERDLAHRHGVRIVALEDADYPQRLRTIYDPPAVLYVRGSLAPSDEIAVAVVGSRHASIYGLQCAERLAYDLALRGVTVVSGLARGIDAAAHRGALKASPARRSSTEPGRAGRTLAVLGNGLSRVYPPEHHALADEVTAHGALISEYPMETAPIPHNFPRRNRIISGLSLGVVIVEAARRSGALITADCALEQGREVFAVPGPITAVSSQGTHHLLKQGARLVTSVEDILDELRLVPQPVRASFPDDRGTAPTAALPEAERRVFACVSERDPLDIDVIAGHSGLAVAEVSSLLLQLEVKQLIRQLPGKRFVRQWK